MTESRRVARVKIRLYNETIEPTPEGQFQGFYEVDSYIDEYEMPIEEEMLLREIELCKYDMWLRFNSPMSWEPFEATEWQYTPGKKPGELEGVPFRDVKVERPRYPKMKPVPEEYVGALNIEELVWGISNKKPRIIGKPEYKIVCERIMVIKDGEVNYDSSEIMEEVPLEFFEAIVRRMKK